MLTVAVRFRPESSDVHDDDDKEEEEEEDKEENDEQQQHLDVYESPKNYIRINNEFNLYFDNVLGFESFQDDVFLKSIKSKANDFLNGNNCCILTYGAKSSGKTYSMFGKLENKNAVKHLGILPRTIGYIIEKLQAFYTNQRNKNAMDWNLFISFGNVYNDKIYDLIDTQNTKNIHLKKNKKTNEYYLKNLTQIKIKKISSFLKNMHLAHENRKYYINKKHTISFSRCHMFAIIKLNVYTINGIDDNGNKQKQKISSTILNFIDCASYPQINYKPKTENDRIDYQHLNFSFIQLNALMTRIAKKNDLTIDNRESVLTKLLYPIRQNHRTLTNVAPHSPKYKEPMNHNIDDYGKLLVMINCTLKSSLRAETMATLRFGNLPTVDPFILGMMEKQRHKIKKLEMKIKETKIKIKAQKKELKQYINNNNHNNNNNDNLQNENKEIRQLKVRLDHLNKIIAKLRKENDELMNKNYRDNDESFSIQNKYEKLLSDFELLKLDFASVKKELNTQKKQNFWLMEDYNDLKKKNEQNSSSSSTSRNIGGVAKRNRANTNDQIGNLLKEIRTLRMEGTENQSLLQKADSKCKEYEMQIDEYEIEIQSIQESHKNELNQLMVGIKERDDQINELRKELSNKDEQVSKEHEIMKNDRQIYEKYIGDLEKLLKENNINFDKYNMKNNDNYNNNNMEHKDVYNDENNDNRDPQFIIRKLRMEIIKYKTDINSSGIVKKLRDKKHKLEEKVINLRTDKAKQIVQFSQEKHKLEQEITKVKQQLHNVNAIRKWVKLVHKRQLLQVSKDMERANRKMKENYKTNSEFREQMHVLRNIAEKRFEHALQHKMNKNKQLNGHYASSHYSPSPLQQPNKFKINDLPPAMVLEPYKSVNTVNGYDDRNMQSVAISSTTDIEQQMVGLLPNNLKRIHQVIDQLTSKLMIKNGQLHEHRQKYDKLSRKYKQLEYNLNLHNRSGGSIGSGTKHGQSSSTSTPNGHNTKSFDDMDDDDQDDDDDNAILSPSSSKLHRYRNGNGNGNGMRPPPPPTTRVNTDVHPDMVKDDESKGDNNRRTHVVTNSSFDSYLPNILDKLNLKQPQFGDEIYENKEEDVDDIKEEYDRLTTDRTDDKTDDFMYHYENVYDDNDLIINNTHHHNEHDDDLNDSYNKEENYLKTMAFSETEDLPSTMTKIQTRDSSSRSLTTRSMTTKSMTKSSNPKQFTFRARGTTKESMLHSGYNGYNGSTSTLLTTTTNDDNNNSDPKSEEQKRKQKQLRLLQQSLSIAFHIDNHKNTRIKLNVSMTPRDVYGEMCDGLINNGDKNKRFVLIIQHNISPDFERIVIPYENTKMSFWECIIEFGILNLLHFNICCDDDVGKYFDDHDDNDKYQPRLKAKGKKKKDKERRGSLWNMFAKK